METMRGWLLGFLGACALLAAAGTLRSPEPLEPPQPPRPPADDVPVGTEPPPLALQSVLLADQPERRVAQQVAGTVVDETGAPVAGVRVAMSGCAAVVTSDADGVFVFHGAERDRCRALPPAGWLAVESPLFALCSPARAPQLVVTRATSIAGRVLDEGGAPVAGAEVAVELLVEPGTGSPARSLRLAAAWSTTSDADGWYSLPAAPTGPHAALVVACDGFAAARVALRAARSYEHVTLARVTAAPAASPPDPVAGHALDGWLGDERDQLRAGWWAAAVPADANAAPDGPWGRYAAPPVRLDADGRFRFAHLLPGRYRLEAWAPDNRAVLRTAEVVVPSPAARLAAHAPALPERVLGRIVDGSGRPVAHATVGLGRPTGWAVPGRLGMHPGTVVTTDRDGRFALATHGLAALELRVAGAPVVPFGITFAGDDAPVEIRAVARRWLGDPDGGSERLSATGALLVAVDGAGRALPIWTGDAPMARMALDGAVAGQFGFPATAHSLVWRAGKREIARMNLR